MKLFSVNIYISPSYIVCIVCFLFYFCSKLNNMFRCKTKIVFILIMFPSNRNNIIVDGVVVCFFYIFIDIVVFINLLLCNNCQV